MQDLHLLLYVPADVHERAVVKEYPSIWLHIDAAWAGIALALPEFREQGRLAAINAYGQSFCTNYHKVYRHASAFVFMR